MAIPVYADFDMSQNQLKNAALDNVAVFPATPVAGQTVFRTTDNKPYVWNGTTWIASEPGVSKFSQNIGPGIGPFTVTHNLGTLDTVESVYNVGTGIEVLAVVTHATVNTTTFAITPALLAAARATIIG